MKKHYLVKNSEICDKKFFHDGVLRRRSTELNWLGLEDRLV